jgi:hypothetical protein
MNDKREEEEDYNKFKGKKDPSDFEPRYIF